MGKGGAGTYIVACEVDVQQLIPVGTTVVNTVVKKTGVTESMLVSQ